MVKVRRGRPPKTPAASESPAPAKRRGRPPKARPAGMGHNHMGDLQLKNLAMQHLAMFKKRLAAKQEADAEFNNLRKLIKAEGGAELLDAIVFATRIDTPEKYAREAERINAQLRMATWLGLPIGTQADMDFPEEEAEQSGNGHDDPKRAGLLGKLAASRGEQCEAPYPPGTPAFHAWVEGWTEHMTHA